MRRFNTDLFIFVVSKHRVHLSGKATILSSCSWEICSLLSFFLISIVTSVCERERFTARIQVTEIRTCCSWKDENSCFGKEKQTCYASSLSPVLARGGGKKIHKVAFRGTRSVWTYYCSCGYRVVFSKAVFIIVNGSGKESPVSRLRKTQRWSCKSFSLYWYRGIWNLESSSVFWTERKRDSGEGRMCFSGQVHNINGRNGNKYDFTLFTRKQELRLLSGCSTPRRCRLIFRVFILYRIEDLQDLTCASGLKKGEGFFIFFWWIHNDNGEI